MDIKFKKIKVDNLPENAVEVKLPTRAHSTDAGIDLFCTHVTQEVDNSGKIVLVYHTGLAVEIPEGFVGLLFMKSSVSNRSVRLTNAVGVIDAGYRGELIGKFKTTTDAVPTIYANGEAFAQLVMVPCVLGDITIVDELGESERNEGGFGSTEASQPVVESKTEE